MSIQFFDRDLSWLSFNERVLTEAANPAVPLLERIKFLSIFSSNLDEFYRVRMPAIQLYKTANNRPVDNDNNIGATARQVISKQQAYFGKVLSLEIIPQLLEKNICLVYNESIPADLTRSLEEYFFSDVAAFLQIICLSGNEPAFFSENNQLYQVVILGKKTVTKL